MTTPRPSWTRWGGLALMGGALLFPLTGPLLGLGPDHIVRPLLIYVGLLAWVAGTLALGLRYAPRATLLGKVGLLLTIAATLILAPVHFATQPPFSTSLYLWPEIGTALLPIGLLLFGVDCWRRQILPRWKYTPLIAGLAGLYFPATWYFFFTPGNIIARAALGIAVFLLGYILWKDTRPQEADTDGNSLPQRGSGS